MSEALSADFGVAVTRLNPSTMWDSTANGHSQISVAEPGRLAFLSGQVAWQADGGALPPDVSGQARMIAASLRDALGALGASVRDVVSLRVYVVDGTTDRFLEAWTAIQDLFGEEKPSATVLGVQALFTP